MASPLLAGLVILMIGDSHYVYPGSLITTLQDLLVNQGASVSTHGACGVQARVWANSGSTTCGASERVQFGPIKIDRNPAAPVPSLATLAASARPNLIIVGMGDTIADYGTSPFPVDRAMGDIADLTKAIRAVNIPCIWVGPGWGEEGNDYQKTIVRTREINQLLANHVAPCQYVDSIGSRQPGEWTTFDGLHYTGTGYQKWAFAIDAAVLKLAPHPDS